MITTVQEGVELEEMHNGTGLVLRLARDDLHRVALVERALLGVKGDILAACALAAHLFHGHLEHFAAVGEHTEAVVFYPHHQTDGTRAGLVVEIDHVAQLILTQTKDAGGHLAAQLEIVYEHFGLLVVVVGEEHGDVGLDLDHHAGLALEAAREHPHMVTHLEVLGQRGERELEQVLQLLVVGHHRHHVTVGTVHHAEQVLQIALGHAHLVALLQHQLAFLQRLQAQLAEGEQRAAGCARTALGRSAAMNPLLVQIVLVLVVLVVHQIAAAAGCTRDAAAALEALQLLESREDIVGEQTLEVHALEQEAVVEALVVEHPHLVVHQRVHALVEQMMQAGALHLLHREETGRRSFLALAFATGGGVLHAASLRRRETDPRQIQARDQTHQHALAALVVGVHLSQVVLVGATLHAYPAARREGRLLAGDTQHAHHLLQRHQLHRPPLYAVHAFQRLGHVRLFHRLHVEEALECVAGQRRLDQQPLALLVVGAHVLLHEPTHVLPLVTGLALDQPQLGILHRRQQTLLADLALAVCAALSVVVAQLVQIVVVHHLVARVPTLVGLRQLGHLLVVQLGQVQPCLATLLSSRRRSRHVLVHLLLFDVVLSAAAFVGLVDEEARSLPLLVSIRLFILLFFFLFFFFFFSVLLLLIFLVLLLGILDIIDIIAVTSIVALVLVSGVVGGLIIIVAVCGMRTMR
mmetsp:Transcript_6548/g.19863  ORF Transcript_6548/g.19863 Transcript_6548/m.19863 type:complete len:694 (+) Transcript_6548:858-2939(+)